MTLGERCDEIVRLIDETLEDYALSAPGGGAVGAGGRAERTEPPMVARLRMLAEAQRLARSA